MQTFLPKSSNDFTEIAKTLDNKRLHKQSLEAWQILMVLVELDPQGNHRTPKGWVNHPAVKMWRGNEVALAVYAVAMTEEWKRRGYKTTIDSKVMATILSAYEQHLTDMAVALPDWMSNPKMFEEIASTHRQALLAKDYAWYSQFGWPEDTGVAPNSYIYKWPVE
jgi:hypothetical protein